MASEAVPKASTMEAVENFLFNEFPRRATFTSKDYETDGQQTTPEAIEKRFKGYQKICLYGFGSVFMSAAISVLDNIQKKQPDWVHWCTFYIAFSLVLMLNGLSAASFPSSTPLALCTAGLGAWKAYVYMLATFHVASLKFHSHVKECVYSMIISTAVVTIHWGYSSQDPLLILVLSKSIVWLVVLTVYGVCKVPLLAFQFIVWVMSALLGLVSKHGNSFLERNCAYRNAKRSSASSSSV